MDFEMEDFYDSDACRGGFCQSCGYALAVHQVAGTTILPDPNGGCPANEAEAMIRWGL